MEKQEILMKVQDIFRDVLDNEEIELNETITADDIDEWDSLSHIQLVVSIEKEFGLRFKSDEMVSWANVGDMINCIIQKKGWN